MQLADYRATMGLTLDQVEEATGINRVMVWKHERGKHVPNPDAIDTYQTFTKGAVRFDDWLELYRARRAPPTTTEEGTLQ